MVEGLHATSELVSSVLFVKQYEADRQTKASFYMRRLNVC